MKNWKKSLDINDEVYWNDPDDGISSGYYKIVKIISDEVVMISDGISEAEVFLDELS